MSSKPNYDHAATIAEVQAEALKIAKDADDKLKVASDRSEAVNAVLGKIGVTMQPVSYTHLTLPTKA